jgi:hypothetical protein
MRVLLTRAVSALEIVSEAYDKHGWDSLIAEINRELDGKEKQ